MTLPQTLRLLEQAINHPGTEPDGRRILRDETNLLRAAQQYRSAHRAFEGPTGTESDEALRRRLAAAKSEETARLATRNAEALRVAQIWAPGEVLARFGL